MPVFHTKVRQEPALDTFGQSPITNEILNTVLQLSEQDGELMSRSEVFQHCDDTPLSQRQILLFRSEVHVKV